MNDVDQLVNDNMALARHFAGKFQALDYDQALSVAMGGLLYAANTWDKARGIPFGAYAAICIRHKMSSEVRKLKSAKRWSGANLVHLDEMLHGTEMTIAELLKDEHPDPAQEMEANGLRFEIGLLLKRLNKRERVILTERFGLGGGDPKILEVLGKRFGITRERIRQLESIALRKLKRWMDNASR